MSNKKNTISDGTTNKKNIGGDVPTNGAKQAIESALPYMATVKIEGTTDLLFHRWNCEEVEEKSRKKKGSDEKKRDNLESYVYRNHENIICLPSEYLRMSIINAAKFQQDPRSSRKSAMDLFKAGIVCLTNLCPLGCERWDYDDKRKVCIQRAGINRTRPAMKAGWKAEFTFMVIVPEYISPSYLNSIIQMAGRLIGLGDFRPTYGRFNVIGFEATQDQDLLAEGF